MNGILEHEWNLLYLYLFIYALAYLNIIMERFMKKFIVLILLVSISLLSLSASSAMTLEQEREYISQSLSVSPRVESSSSIFASAYAYKNTAFGSATSSSSTSLNWDAYLGANLISKKEFFKIAGYEDLYEQCLEVEEHVAKKRKDGVTLTVVGGVACVTGLCIMLSSLDSLSYDALYAGEAIALLGCLPLYFGIEMMGYEEEPNISTSFAMGIADVYNKQLAAKFEMTF